MIQPFVGAGAVAAYVGAADACVGAAAATYVQCCSCLCGCCSCLCGGRARIRLTPPSYAGAGAEIGKN